MSIRGEMAGYRVVDSRWIEELEHGRFVSCQARSDIVGLKQRCSDDQTVKPP
jgi:hypothetical protein